MRNVTLLTMLFLLPAPLAAQSVLDQIRDALRLPAIAADARQSGVPDAQVSDVLDQIRRRRLPAGDASRVLDEELRAVREGGPVDNFGAFVQTQLDAGLRGRALAEAIRAEHARRGIGRPDNAGQGREAEPGRAGEAGRPDQPGQRRPDDAGQGRPDDAGQGRQPDRAMPDEAGQPDRVRRDSGNAARPAPRGGRP